MGFQKAIISTITKLLAEKLPKGNGAATLGTQTVFCHYHKLIRILLKNGITPAPITGDIDLDIIDQHIKSEKEELDCSIYLRLLGFADIVNIDIFPVNEYSLIHDLNGQAPESLQNRFSLILDGSTGHHIFDAVQLLKNVKDMLRVGGMIFHSVLLDPLCQSASFLNLHRLYQFYSQNGFGNCRAFFCSLFQQNNIFEIKGDLDALMDFAEKEKFYLLFVAEKQENVKLNTRILSIYYEVEKNMARQLDSLPDKLAGKKVAIWGTSGHYREHYRPLLKLSPDIFEMVGFVDNNQAVWDTVVDGYRVFPPERLKELQPDVVLLASWQKTALFASVCRHLSPLPEVIKNTYELYHLTFKQQDLDDIHLDYNTIRGIR